MIRRNTRGGRAGAGTMGGLAAALALVLTLAAAPARADDPELLTFGAGMFDVSDDPAVALNIEYTDDRRWLWVLQPMTGAMVTLDGALYGYAGLGVDLFFGRRLVVTPSLAAGLYFEGGGKDLGHVVEFRSSIKIGYRLDDRSRIGVDISHLSNAGLDDRNPGANQILFTYSMPLGQGR